MLFFRKKNVFMYLVAFQKMFRKIFFDVWLCSWKYHRKHIFYLLLTFSQLPNEYIISFIPKNTNKTQKRSHFFGEIAIAITITIEIGAISIGEIEIVIALDTNRRSSGDHDRDRRRSFSLSLSRWVCFVRVGFFFLWLSLSLFCAFFGNRLKVKQQCKMISGSTM